MESGAVTEVTRSDLTEADVARLCKNPSQWGCAGETLNRKDTVFVGEAVRHIVKWMDIMVKGDKRGVMMGDKPGGLFEKFYYSLWAIWTLEEEHDSITEDMSKR